MTSDTLSEATHFRGKTLSPESPIPVHIPEPSNIPVLQNQIDPIFNLMSTHVEQSQPPEDMTIEVNHSQHPDSGVKQITAAWNKTDDFLADGENIQDDRKSEGEGDIDYVGSNEYENRKGQQDYGNLQNHSSSSTTQPSTSIAVNENFSQYTQNEPASLYPDHSQSPSGDPFQYLNPREPSPDAPVTGSPETTTHESTEQNNTHVQASDTDVVNGGVNYQTLLDNLSPSTATAPTAEAITSATTAAPSGTSNAPGSSNLEAPLAALPIPVGLPPRPPPQEKPAIHPNYTPGEDIRSYHYPHTQNSTTHKPYTSQSSNPYRPSQGFSHPASGNAIGANGLPPPPLATFQQPSPMATQSQRSPLSPPNRHRDSHGRNGEMPGVPAVEEEDELPWNSDTEQKYTEFLQDEGVYVTEGLWDRFPQGSRLFVGNLYSEKVTKRDLFNMFHRYGRLAQISIKNAYGFIQYLDSSCCLRALQSEQGMPIRGRKMHLEISKPQKNSRNASATAAGDSLRAGQGRRSRSPDYARGPPLRGNGQRMSGERFDRGVPLGNFRDEPRRRDDYRPVRSPSPRGFRNRDQYRGGRDRSPDRYFGGRRSRSRSPYGRNGRYRSRSPMDRGMDDEADLPIARRDRRDVPDVQLILVDEVDRTFVAYIEKTFRDRGLRCGMLQLPRISLDAVIKRQILEGVQAVVKIFRQSQVSGKIPLQVFDRSAGVENVRFEEYEELDANIAAELVVRAKSTHLAPAPPQYTAASAYGVPHYGQPPQHALQHQHQLEPQPAAGGPNLANLITSLDGPALQKLLGAMAQTPQTPQTPQLQTPQQQAQAPDLASLLGNVQRQPPTQQRGYPYAGPQQHHPPQSHGYAASPTNHTFAQTPALAPYLSDTGNRHPQHNMHGQQPHVQNIMDQLAKWKQ